MEENHLPNLAKTFADPGVSRMLQQIYGRPSASAVSYPKIHTRKVHDRPGFIPGGAKPSSSDPRRAKSSKKVSVPKFRHSLDIVVPYKPQRRVAEKIQEEIESIEDKSQHYRPAFITPVSTTEEKARLGEICECKGGRILPEELTHVPRETKQERQERMAEVQRVENALERRRLKRLGGTQPEASSPSCGGGGGDVESALVVQIRSEIVEREAFMRDLERPMAEGGPHGPSGGRRGDIEEIRRRVEGEIEARRKEITRLD